MGGAGIYPSGFNPTFSPVEFHLSFCTFRADENIKISKYCTVFSTGHNSSLIIYHLYLSCTCRAWWQWLGGQFLSLNPELCSRFWPDSVSCLRCSAVCLRGLSELGEQTVVQANISSQAKGLQFNLYFNHCPSVGLISTKKNSPMPMSVGELF